jgi:hypothetical protein
MRHQTQFWRSTAARKLLTPELTYREARVGRELDPVRSIVVCRPGAIRTCPRERPCRLVHELLPWLKCHEGRCRKVDVGVGWITRADQKVLYGDLCLLKSPFLLRQLMLLAAVATILGHDVGAALAPSDAANVGANARRAPARSAGLRAPAAGVAAHPASPTREDRPVALGHLSRIWSGWRTALVIVKPETVIAWHRRGFRRWWGLEEPPHGATDCAH